MPNYRYQCPEGHVFEVWRSIKDATEWELACACGNVAIMHMTSPAIAADALPNKMHGVRAANQRDKRWDTDMGAYKRLRGDGIQPKGIDGSAAIEAKANSVLEVEMGRPLGKEKDVRRAQEIASELLCQDVTKTGSEIGKAKRSAA